MRGRRLESICTALLVALASWYWLRYFNRSTNLLDEGSTAAQAMRIVNGDLIYRDFFTVVTPGSYYTIAWLFRLFGESLMLLRWAALVTGIVILLDYFDGWAASNGLAVRRRRGTLDHGLGLVPGHAEFLFARSGAAVASRACLLRVRRAIVAMDGGRGRRRGRYGDGEAECRRVYGSRPLRHDLGIAFVRRSP